MIPDNIPIKQRLHITFGKLDALRYTSNLDLAKLWERVLRRAGLPILYSQGFNPRPRIQLGTALPLGIASECEILDVSLKQPITLDDLVQRLNAVSPTGLRTTRVVEIPVRHPALQTLVRSAKYRIRFEDNDAPADLPQRIQLLLDAATLNTERDRKGKHTIVNIRPLIYSLEISDQGDLIARLAVGDQGNLRPDQLLAEMGLNDRYVSVHRLRLDLDSATRPTVSSQEIYILPPIDP